MLPPIDWRRKKKKYLLKRKKNEKEDKYNENKMKLKNNAKHKTK